jgi:hypothetical protein
VKVSAIPFSAWNSHSQQFGNAQLPLLEIAWTAELLARTKLACRFTTPPSLGHKIAVTGSGATRAITAKQIKRFAVFILEGLPCQRKSMFRYPFENSSE